MVNAIRRLSVPENRVGATHSFYRSPRFIIRDMFGTSEHRKQRTGIRRGRPRSCYLSIRVVSVLMHDVHQELGEALNRAYVCDISVRFCTLAIQ